MIKDLVKGYEIWDSFMIEKYVVMLEGIIKKNFLWSSRLWVGRRKEPILGYVPKKDEKRIWED